VPTSANHQVLATPPSLCNTTDAPRTVLQVVPVASSQRHVCSWIREVNGRATNMSSHHQSIKLAFVIMIFVFPFVQYCRGVNGCRFNAGRSHRSVLLSLSCIHTLVYKHTHLKVSTVPTHNDIIKRLIRKVSIKKREHRR
jgi:hypothetical protein